jgi:hypothetical protein
MGSALLEHLDYLTADEQQELDEHLVALTSGVAMVRYQKDPIGFARDVLKIPEQQIRWSLNPGYADRAWDGTPDPLVVVAQALADWNDVGVESGTGTGKSFFVAVLILWFLACFEDSLVNTHAPKEDQLTKAIWKEIGKLWSRFQPHFPQAELLSLSIRMRGGLDQSWAANGVSVGIVAGEVVAGRAQGAHAKDMLTVYEETPSIPVPVIEAGENTSTAPHNLRIAVGNPNHRLDALHKFCTSPGVVHVRISALDHPNVVMGDADFIPGAVSVKSIERRREKYGESSPVFQSRVRGESPEQSADALIRLEWLEAAAARYRARRDAGTIPHRITGKGIDVANSEHGDRAAVCDFAENVVVALDAFPCPDSNKLGADQVMDAKLHGLPSHRVGVDPIGVGAGTVNEARRLKYPVQALNFGAKPYSTAQRAPDGSKYEWAADANRFQNFRGQCYWQFREDLQAGLIDMDEDRDVWEELLAMSFDDDGNVVKLPPKDDLKTLLGRSPDKADALVMANWVRERKVVNEPPLAKDAKQPHRAAPIKIENGRVLATKRQPQTVTELMDQIESKRAGRLPHRERLPRRTYG